MKKYKIRTFSPIWFLLIFALVITVWFGATIYFAKTAYAKELPRLTTAPTTTCNLSGSQLDQLLEETELDGLGQAFEDGEDATGINALFVASIVVHESGWGTSRLAREENNLGGIVGRNGYRSFNSKEECISYMFDLLNRLYIGKGRDTVEKISKIYCVPPGHWEESINRIMNDFIEDASITRE